MSGSICVWWLAAGLLCGCGGVSVNMPGPSGGSVAGAKVSAPDPIRTSEKAASPLVETKESISIEKALRQVQAGKLTYRIGPADLLEISVFREKEMERKVRVTPNGTITFPLVGSIEVGGLGIAQAEQALVNKLKTYLVNPQVSIFIIEYGNKLVYVLGEVKNPGSYSLPTEATLSVLEAVTLAGGFTPYAALDRTRVIRKSGGQNQNFQVEITAITQKGDKSKDIVLMPNDVVFVPESFF